MVYYIDSAICKAAIHSGMIPADGGSITVELANGLEAYEAAMQNGVQSMAFDYGTASMFFHKDASEIITVTCDETAAKEEIASKAVEEVVYLDCPENCASSDAPLFGTDIYSEDSAICKAGAHFGNIGNKGGELKI